MCATTLSTVASATKNSRTFHNLPAAAPAADAPNAPTAATAPGADATAAPPMTIGGSGGAALAKATRQTLAIVLNITLKEKFVITRMK